MGVLTTGFYQSADSDLESAERLFQIGQLTKKLDDWMSGWVTDDSQVYEDEFEYYAEYLADFDLEKAERIYKKYSRATIARAAISKMKNG